MAVQTMINNGCTIVAYIDNDTVGETYDIFYFDTTGSNPAKYTVANKWDAGDGDWKGDVAAMVNDLLDRGLPATDLIVGTDVAAFIQSDEATLKLLDNRRAEYGRLAPQVRYPGVVWIGNLNFDGTDLDIFSVRETVLDKDGTIRLFPATSAMVTAPDCRPHDVWPRRPDRGRQRVPQLRHAARAQVCRRQGQGYPQAASGRPPPGCTPEQGPLDVRSQRGRHLIGLGKEQHHEACKNHQRAWYGLPARGGEAPPVGTPRAVSAS